MTTAIAMPKELMAKVYDKRGHSNERFIYDIELVITPANSTYFVGKIFKMNNRVGHVVYVNDNFWREL